MQGVVREKSKRWGYCTMVGTGDGNSVPSKSKMSSTSLASKVSPIIFFGFFFNFWFFFGFRTFSLLGLSFKNDLGDKRK